MATAFSPTVRAERLLRQSAGLMPPSDVQPASGLNPIKEALINRQFAAGLLTKEQFLRATGASGFKEQASRTSLRRSARRARTARRRIQPSTGLPALTGPSFFGGPVFPNENINRRRLF